MSMSVDVPISNSRAVLELHARDPLVADPGPVRRVQVDEEDLVVEHLDGRVLPRALDVADDDVGVARGR